MPNREKPRLADEDRLKLRFGPYSPPAVHVGDWIECEVRGEVRVGSWSDGRIPWPRVRGIGHGMILCGDLARALRTEAVQSISFWWGVSRGTVGLWKRQMGIRGDTAGTRAVHRDWKPLNMTVEDELRGKISREQLKAYLKRLDTLSRKAVKPNQRVWTADEDALLGVLSNQAIAQRLGCYPNAVISRRRALGIPSLRPTLSQGDTIRRLIPGRLLERRTSLGLTQAQVAARMAVSRGHYSRLEVGAYQMLRSKTLERLAKALDCEPANLAMVDPPAL
jgi:DNA-binding Xre family transcriptional regulator